MKSRATIARIGISGSGHRAIEAQRLAECDEAVTRARRQLIYAYMRADALPWPERVRVAVAALLAFLDEEPVLTEILFGESLRDRPLPAARRAHLLERLNLHVHADGSGAEGALNTPGLSAEAMIGVACTVIETHLRREDPRPLSSLTGTLAGLIVLPYLGPRAALAEMTLSTQPIPTNQAGGN